MTDRDFEAQIRGFGLTTAEILYRMPDHPALVQSYIWQDYDLHPRFPKLIAFLDFWSEKLDGAVSRVRIAHRGLVSPREFRFVDGLLQVH